MTLDHRQQHLETIRSGLYLIVYPLQVLADAPTSLFNWANESLSSRTLLLKDNRQLRVLQLEFQGQLQKFSSLEMENTRLRELLQSSKKVDEQVLIGELLAVDLDPFKRQVFINKGSREGVFNGQALLDAHGIMGQINHVSIVSSTAILITDPAHVIPVQVNRNGLRAIARGTGETHRLEIPHLPNSTDIEVGDLLITSGLGQRFPAGYPVARVTHIERDPGQPYAQIIAEPSAQLERSREVLLVQHTPQHVLQPSLQQTLQEVKP